MAVGFIIIAAWRIGKKVVKDKLTLLLMLFGAAGTYLVRLPWIFPLVLIIGGATSILASREKDIWNKSSIAPPWHYLFLFILFAAGSIALSALTDIRLIRIFESFYRYRYLVFGGG